MPELDFKGKEFVRNHHLTVPYRPLVPVPEKGIGDPDLSGNLIIHGDNLEALKSLLPMYAGKVDCIFIDPPYNTGNEGWTYSDNVNSPVIKKWFSENPVGIDDGLRHDKWCCMMWPRLRLLKELLAPGGTIWITIDDVESGRLRQMLDDIFGEENFVATVCWQKKYATANDTVDFSDMHDFVHVYVNERPISNHKQGRAVLARLERTEAQNALYRNPDSDSRGPWMSGDYTCNKTADERPALFYPIENPYTKEQVWPNRARVWRTTVGKHAELERDNRIWWGENGENDAPRLKRFLSEVGGTVASTWWPHEFAGHTDEAKKLLRAIFGEQQDPFATPKPLRLLRRILDLAIGDKEDAIVLDSFAGSGTTAHAVLAGEYPGSKFIMVEMEPYADSLTAERVRRVMRGYSFVGAQRQTLFERRLTWTEIKNADSLKQDVKAVKAMQESEFDDIEVKVEDGILRLSGIRHVAERTEGLGGNFTYCELGEPIELQRLLSGVGLPKREALVEYLLYLAGIDPIKLEHSIVPAGLSEYYVGSIDSLHIWLMYQPDLKYLSSTDAALTLETARAMHATDKGGQHRVYSPAKYVGTKALWKEGIVIDHVPLPLALFRGHTG